MKKYIIISLMICGMILTSCDQFIEKEVPFDLITADAALQDLDDYNQALIGVYDALSGIYGGNLYSATSAYADNVIIGTNNAGQFQFDYNHNGSTGLGSGEGFWLAYYSLIFRANTVLENLPNLPVDGVDVTQDAVDQIRGEALALRALGHFDLVRLFAQPYAATPDQSHLGVPVATSVLPPSATPTRNTVAEVYAQIIQDLTEAESLMNSSVGVTQFDATSIGALLARVYLYSQNYNLAITKATEAIDAVALATLDNYSEVWTDLASDGIIFRLGMPLGSPDLGDAWYDAQTNTAFLNPSDDLLSLYDENDVRLDVFFEERADGEGNFVDIVDTKYPGTTANPGLVDVPILRTAEMYLIRAEAYARSNQEGLALADFNNLRRERITGYSDNALSGDALLNAISLERRRELNLEGHRWFDLRRTNESMFRNDCNGDLCELSAGDFRFTLAIPQSEVFANDNMVQNPGYSE